MIVVDCSVVVDVLTWHGEGEVPHDELAGRDLHAPALLDYEVVSALRGLTLGAHLEPARASAALLDFDDLPSQRWHVAAPLRERAFALRDNLTAYDAAYVALAEALQCPLLTRDARLGRSRGHDAEIRVL